uniref:RNA-directed DNA polymerase n=1 Tax=Anopheles atroparvus TaxID=41427 RepID=A0AAG5CRQ8_ANOAO
DTGANKNYISNKLVRPGKGFSSRPATVRNHHINTKDDIPVYTKSYRYPYCHKDEVQKQVNALLEQGIIRPSNSPWSSPIWIVPKKSDSSGERKWRLVIDYRKLNIKTISDRYPIPNITEILDKLGRCIYFSTLDLAAGFHQIEVNDKDIQKTAFSVDNGHYEFVRMPFGLKNAPSTFQRVMDNILREHIGRKCLVYMDDIIVFSTSLQENIINLKAVFQTIEKYNLKIQLEKSEFLKKDVAFLGHIVTPNGVKPNPDKISVIQNWAIPTKETDLRSFLGVIGYYRKFIKDFAKITKPLTAQLRKGESIAHSKEFISAFEKCKTILTSSQILIYPDFEKPFTLTTDASKYAIGAVLSQGSIGQDKPIAFASRTLSKHEENYSTIEKELLAIDWACKYFRPYLFGRKFILYTDHKPLTLEEYDYEIRHRSGKQNVVADGLSRINLNTEINSSSMTAHSADTDDSSFIQMTELPLNFFKNQIVLKFSEHNNETHQEIFPRTFRHTIARLNFDESVLVKIMRDLTDDSRITCIFCPTQIMNLLQEVFRKYFARIKASKIRITQAILTDLITPEEQNEIIAQTHDRAHRGVDENHSVIIRSWYFPKMKNKIRSFVNLCEICLENKYERKPYKIKLAETPIPQKPLDIVHMDIFISLPNLFLTAVDKLSRYAMIVPLKSRSIPDVKRSALKLITTYGTPKMVVCDNELSFKSVEIRGLLDNLNVQMKFTPSNHSEENGIVERFHSTLTEIFLCIKEKYNDCTDKEIYKIAASLYNSSIHQAIKAKPIEVFFGIKDGDERPLNIDSIIRNRDVVFDDVIVNLKNYQNKCREKANVNKEDGPELKENESVVTFRMLHFSTAILL